MENENTKLNNQSIDAANPPAGPPQLLETPQTKSHKGLTAFLVMLVLAGTTAYFAYKNYQYNNLPPTQNQETPLPPPSPTPTNIPKVDGGIYSPITEENDWGYITIKQIGNELNAMTPARYTFANLPITTKVSKYTDEEVSCPELKYHLQDKEDYTLFLLLPHTGLRPSTTQTDESISLNGNPFTKTSHYTDNKLTAILYKSDSLSINHNNTSLEYTWTAYLTADTDNGIDESIASAAEDVIGQVEIQEINDSELSTCQIKQQSQ